MLFPWYIKYPNQNDEILNLDWILSTIDNLVKEVSDFVTLNTIKYADPIQWNITTQYEKNTVVIDPITGSAYISTKPVPAGVGLNNTDYWNVIFTLDVISANKNITLRDDANNILATFESEVDDWLLWQGTLYIVTRTIEIGQSYVAGYNIERYTVERFLKEYITNLRTYVDTFIGDLDDLETSVKTDVVSAINSLLTDVTTLIGDLTDLETTDKDSVVDAINELVQLISDINTNIGTLSQLDTATKTSIVAAINEVVSYCGDLDNLNTTVKTSLVDAINEIVFSLSDIGNLSALKTREKSSLVGAINSIVEDTYINVKNYGAKGDGVTNDFDAFIAAIAATPIHGTLFIPMGTYYISSQININKPIRILGAYSGWDVEDANADVTNAQFKQPLIKSNSDNIALNITCLGFTMENISIECINTGQITACVRINNSSSTVVQFNRFINIKNCTFSNTNTAYGAGLRIEHTGLCHIDRVLVYGFAIGFYLTQLRVGSELNTSILITSCWAENYYGTGYSISDSYYCVLLNCAADSTRSNTNGYVLNKCDGVSLLNCGAEQNLSGFILDNCFNCSISGMNVAINDSNDAILLRYSGWVHIHDFSCKGTFRSDYTDVRILTSGIRVLLHNTNIYRIWNVTEQLNNISGFNASNIGEQTFTFR